MLGATLDLSAWSSLPLRALLFGEAQGRAVLTTSDVPALLAIAAKHGVPSRQIGTVTAARAGLNIRAGERSFIASIETLSNAWHDAIPRAMQRAPAETVSTELAAGVSA